MKFRKKPIEIEAIQFDPVLLTDMLKFAAGKFKVQTTDCGQMRLVIDTREGDMFASPGDWIIKGVKGEFYPCKPDIFEMSYEKV
jgi:hypothetical protein